MNGDKYDSAIIGRVVSITKEVADVDLGGGTSTRVNIALVKVKVGDLVLVHGGYAIQVIDESEAEETLKRWKG